MKRVLLDVNVLLDVLLEREPFVVHAAALWREVELGRLEGLVPAHGVTTIAYLSTKAHDRAFSQAVLADLLRVFGVATVDGEVLRDALSLAWSDYEDAVCACAALRAGCDHVITRDPAGFRTSPVPTLDAATAAATLLAAG